MRSLIILNYLKKYNMANFEEHNFEEQINNTTFKSKIVTITITNSSGTSPLDLTGATINLWWRRGNANGSIVKKMSIGDGLTLSDPTNGKFTIDKFFIDWGAGTYYFDIKITDASGDKDAQMFGTILIKEDSTDE